MYQQIIEKYKSNYSLDFLSKEFNIGKEKIKKILTENNVPIKKRGGQIKYKFVDQIPFSDCTISCKSCKKEFNDFENKSGAITEHIKKCFSDITIPSAFKRRMYKKSVGTHWHLLYFNIEPKKNIKTLKCLECDWETKDLTNKTGSLTKHIERNHKSIDYYLSKHPEQKKLFPFIQKCFERETLFKDVNNFVTCQICGEQFKTISNTHLNLHNTNIIEYKTKYGDDSIICKKTKNDFVNNLKNCVINFSYRSKSELEIEQFIKSLNVKVVVCDKKQLSGVELDMFLPEYNIAFEYNGLYWHSENKGKHKNYHLDKTLKCLSKNIQLIHIFSDEWLTKKEIIKNRIKNLLKKNEEKIYARNCQIVDITKSEKKEFLNQNHLQGDDKSSIYFGLKYNGELVAVMTFGGLRKILGNNQTKKNEFELYRFCSKNVVGGFSKLFKHFIQKINPKKIITYSNRNWTPSENFCFYSKVGFKYIGFTKPNYSYTKKYDIREHRFNYRKDKLIRMGYDKEKTEEKIMFELGYDRIWDTGNLKYEYVV